MFRVIISSITVQVPIGSDHPIALQTMTTSLTSDVQVCPAPSRKKFSLFPFESELSISHSPYSDREVLTRSFAVLTQVATPPFSRHCTLTLPRITYHPLAD
jgi:hypothetical protein